MKPIEQWLVPAWDSIIHAGIGKNKEHSGYLTCDTASFKLNIPSSKIEELGGVDYVMSMLTVAAAAEDVMLSVTAMDLVNAEEPIVTLGYSVEEMPEHAPEIAAEEFDDDTEELEVDEEDDADAEDEDEEDDAQPVINSKKATLKVLVNPEMHKLASRIYGTVNKSDNMSTFMEFLREFDALLNDYSTDNADNAKPRGASEEEAAALLEVASEYLEVAKAFKYKEGRAGLLSALMKSLSGDKGEAITKAWDGKNADKLESLFAPVIKALSKLLQTAETAAAEDAEEPVEEPAENTVVPTLYLSRDVTNEDVIKEWAKAHGLPELNDDLHVTLGYSKTPVDIDKYHSLVTIPETIRLDNPDGTGRSLTLLGDNLDSVVLQLSSVEIDQLGRFNKAVSDAGGTWEYPEYLAHVTLFTISETFDKSILTTIPAFQGTIELGPEQYAPVSDGASKEEKED